MHSNKIMIANHFNTSLESILWHTCLCDIFIIPTTFVVLSDVRFLLTTQLTQQFFSGKLSFHTAVFTFWLAHDSIKILRYYRKKLMTDFCVCFCVLIFSGVCDKGCVPVSQAVITFSEQFFCFSWLFFRGFDLLKIFSKIFVWRIK